MISKSPGTWANEVGTADTTRAVVSTGRLLPEAVDRVGCRARRTVERFECHGKAEASSRSATSTITYRYETGRVEQLIWNIVSDDEDHYFASELRGGVEGRGQPVGRDFRWIFQVPMPGRYGTLLSLTAEATYTLLSPTTAMGITRFRLFGLTVQTMTAFFQHNAEAAA